jgi:PhnB protein
MVLRQRRELPTREEIPMVSLSPFLAFDGTCEEAFGLYRSVFGGEFEGVNRYSEMPPDAGVAPEDAEKIMYIALPLGEGQVLRGSDRPPGAGQTTFGNSVSIMVTPGSADEGRRIFDALAAGGQVTMPYERQFWGDDYGQLVDRFGINWQVDYRPSEG